MSMKSCLSGVVKKLTSILIFESHSGVRRDPRGTIFPVHRVEFSKLLHVPKLTPSLTPLISSTSSISSILPLTPPPGLIPLGKGTFDGNTFLPFRLYILCTNALHFH